MSKSHRAITAELLKNSHNTLKNQWTVLGTSQYFSIAEAEMCVYQVAVNHVLEVISAAIQGDGHWLQFTIKNKVCFVTFCEITYLSNYLITTTIQKQHKGF